MRLIDADSLKDLEEMDYIYFASPAAVPFYEAHKVWDVIDNAPTIDAEPVKHGRWDKNWDGDNIVYCDQCYIPQDMPTPYCPHCGARMDGDEDATD